MKFRLLLLINLIALPFIALSQNQFIIGSWVKTKVETYDKKITKLIRDRNNTFLKYTFENSEKVYFSLTYNEKGNEIRYKIKNDVIDFGFNKMKIESIDSINLVVVELEDGNITPNSARIYFMREKAFLDKMPMEKEGFYLADKDTIFFENTKIHPIFNHKTNNDVKDFLQPFVEGLSEGKESYALVTFILNTDGKISDIKMHHHINKSYDKNLLKAIFKTEGSWISPEINGKKVKVLKEIEFAYLASFGSTGSRNPFDHTNNIFPKEYRENFKNAVKSACRGNYKSALDMFTNCLELTPDNSNINYQKSIYFELLNDTINTNLFIEEVKKSNLKYLVKDKK